MIIKNSIGSDNMSLTIKIMITLNNKEIIIEAWLFFLLFFLIVFLITFSFIYYKQKKNHSTFQKKTIENNTKTPFYFRDIPFENIEVAFWVGTYYGIIENISDFIGAMLLKWIKEDKLDVINENNKTIIDMRKIFKTDLGFESDIYIKLLACAGKNRMLEEKEFKNFFKNNEKILNDLFLKMKKEVEAELLTKGFITKKRNDFGTEKIIITDSLKQKAIELQGLKNFLLNFSNIEDKNSIEVHIWDDYLIYAQLLGIADQAESELEKVYPDYNKIVKLNMTKVALINGITASLEITVSLLLAILLNSVNQR